MENLVFTQLTIPEVKQLFRQELESFFENHKPGKEQTTIQDELLTVPEAAKFLSLSVPSIYSLIGKAEIPVMKRAKRCYFYKKDLLSYLNEGKKKTTTQIEGQAANYIKSTSKKNRQP